MVATEKISLAVAAIRIRHTWCLLGMSPRLRTLVLSGLALIAAASLRADYQEKADELEALRDRIEAIESDLSERRDQRDQVAANLRRLEEDIGAAAARLERLDERIAEAEDRVAGLRADVEAEQQSVEGHRQVLREEIRDAYVSGRQQQLKLLLNQEDPAAVDRLLVYFDYISRARAERIDAALAAMARLRDMQTALEEELHELQALRDDQEAERDHLAERRRDRETVLERVEAAIGDDQDRLERLAEDEQELESLVDDLQAALEDVPDQDLQEAPFADRRGDLPWPVRGELAARFGEERNSGGDWRGLLVRAEMGERVEAVSHGRVVFADWLRGLGLLLIIDHGDGHMTLYGYNQSLYSDVGDWVDAGDVVARVGDSGGRDQPGLYFELRVQGQPEDPMQWLDSEG